MKPNPVYTFAMAFQRIGDQYRKIILNNFDKMFIECPDNYREIIHEALLTDIKMISKFI